MLPNVGDLLQLAIYITALIVALSKLVSLWGTGKRDARRAEEDARAAHEQRFDSSWKRLNDLLDESQADNDRLRVELAAKISDLAAKNIEIAKLRVELVACYENGADRRKKPRGPKILPRHEGG